MQIVDHCTIYFLIVGTYTAILLNSMIPAYPVIGWGLLFAEWGMAALAITLTAIDLKKYEIFSRILRNWPTPSPEGEPNDSISVSGPG